MKDRLLLYLGCPQDRTPFTATFINGDLPVESEIENGTLECSKGHKYEIKDGVPRFPEYEIQAPEGMHGNIPWIPQLYAKPISAPPAPWEQDSYYQRMTCLGEFAKNNGIKTVLDLGTDLGRSATIFSRAGCEVVTIDIEDRGAYGYLRNEKNLYCVLANDIHPPLVKNAKFDMVFVDTNHTYETTAKEVEIYLPMATKAIGFDDIDWEGVSRVVSGFNLEKIGQYIGVLRK